MDDVRVSELKRDLENAKHPADKARLKAELDAALGVPQETAVRKPAEKAVRKGKV